MRGTFESLTLSMEGFSFAGKIHSVEKLNHFVIGEVHALHGGLAGFANVFIIESVYHIMELRSADREKKLRRRDFLEEIEKASSEEYVTEWDSEGKIGVQKKKSNIERGSVSKSAGGNFELKVRGDLEEKGWIVDKWSNNVDLDEGRVVACRRVFKRFGVGKSVMTIGTGFPDFVCFEKRGNLFKVIGVEVKMNGNLSREEKLKCAWLLKRGIFSEILVASKVKEKNRVRVVYVDFLEIGKRMRKGE